MDCEKRGIRSFELKILDLDEAGDHSLVNLTSERSIFVLGGVIVDRSYSRTELEPRVRAFKQHWFGTDRIILHSSDIAGARRGFERLRRDRGFREAFLTDLSELMRRLDYRVVACVIHKDVLVARDRERTRDPYDLGLTTIVETFCAEIGDVVDGGLIYAEKRRSDLDQGLDVAWERLRREGTERLNQRQIGQLDNRIVGLNLKAKSVNIEGLQLADLAISTVRRHVLGLSTHDNWEIVQSKLCHGPNSEFVGYGLVTLPEQKSLK